MTTEELEKLDCCCGATGESRSEIIRQGVDIIYARLKKLEKK